MPEIHGPFEFLNTQLLQLPLIEWLDQGDRDRMDNASVWVLGHWAEGLHEAMDIV